MDQKLLKNVAFHLIIIVVAVLITSVYYESQSAVAYNLHEEDEYNPHSDTGGAIAVYCQMGEYSECFNLCVQGPLRQRKACAEGCDDVYFDCVKEVATSIGIV